MLDIVLEHTEMITLGCITLTFLLLLIKFFQINKKHENRKIKELNEVPCPNGLPVLGNISEVFRNKDDLWKTSRRKALDYYPIYRQKILNKNIIFLMDPEDVKMLLSDTNGSKKGTFYDSFRRLEGGLGANDGESHNRRKLLKKWLQFSIVNNFIDRFNKEISHFVDELQNDLDKCIDIGIHVKKLTFKVIMELIFGNTSNLTEEESWQYLKSMETLTELTLLRSLKPHLSLIWPILQLKKDEDEAMRLMHSYTSKAMEQNSRRICRDDGDISNMLSLVRSSSELVDSETIRNKIDTFIFASHDTSSSSLSFTMIALANYPAYQDKIYQEMKSIMGVKSSPTYDDLTQMEFLDMFIKESLRLYPPVVMIERTLTKELITATGFRLPTDTTVFIPIFDIHRTPRLYPDPELFDPDRFLPEEVVKRHPFSHIPFSAGPTSCIAQKYAFMVMKAIICGLLQNFKLEPVTNLENVEFSVDVILKIKGGFKVQLRKR